jgi:hypothetical protein
MDSSIHLASRKERGRRALLGERGKVAMPSRNLWARSRRSRFAQGKGSRCSVVQPWMGVGGAGGGGSGARGLPEWGTRERDLWARSRQSRVAQGKGRRSRVAQPWMVADAAGERGTRAAGARHAGARFVGSISSISLCARKGEPISWEPALWGERDAAGGARQNTHQKMWTPTLLA